MKRLALTLAMAFSVVFVSGCKLTPDELHQVAIESATLAGDQAYKATFDRLKKEGLPDEAARATAEAAKKVAQDLAQKIADEAASRAAGAKGSKTSQGILSVLFGIAQVALGLGLGKPKGV